MTSPATVKRIALAAVAGAHGVRGEVKLKLFGDGMEEQFGTLGASLFTLFQLMTLDDWANIVKPAMELQPYALLFFMPFIVVSTFVVLNLFIGVIVDSIQTLREQEPEGVQEQIARDREQREQAELLAEIRALREALKARS